MKVSKTKHFSKLVTEDLSEYRKKRRLSTHWTGFRYGSLGLKRFIQVVSSINFGCNFNKVTCVRYRGNQPQRPDERACCRNCEDFLGHFQSSYPSESICRLMDKYWDNATGFWRKGLGCGLPREYRSPTCTCYHCYSCKPDTVTHFTMHLLKSLFWGHHVNFDRLPLVRKREFSRMFIEMEAMNYPHT